MVEGLTADKHRTFGQHEHTADVTQHMVGHLSLDAFHATNSRERGTREIEKRFADGYIDMYRRAMFQQCLVDQPFAVPSCLIISRFWQ